MEKKKTDPLSSSLAKLSGSSRGIPSDKDFHFYNNFDEYKHPIREIADKSQSMLESIGQSSAHLWGKEMVLPEDYDDAYEWLVNVNDEVFERFDCSVDEFQKLRKCEDENGFQLVYGKKKGVSQVVDSKEAENSSLSEVKVAYKGKKSLGTKPKVPFHIPTIRRPQDEYKILVNNSNQPFEHVWLQRSEDGSRFIHPLEKFSAIDFVDKNISDIEPIKPPPVECTPYKLVEEVKDLKELAAKLRGVDEFAVDLEHNQYRSYQGLTCLMQISTRANDFVVDTLKLRIHIGPHLREVFKDPTKKKVMHGADHDIIWLERDFGIYVCNLFDTGQASRVLKLERNSLEYLLHHFCGVAANKEYQNADWRLRPLTDEMLRYAREDTHYLLHIYDLMRIRLLSLSTESGNSETSTAEVYQRSYDICMQLYEKEILTDSSYLHIYGIRSADLNAQQLAIVAGLCEWRDVVARAEDESTGYILPNKILLEIAKQMPLTTNKLRRLVKSKNQYIDRNLGSVVNIIRHSMQNAAAYESIAKQLKEERIKATSDGNLVVADGSEASSHPVVLARSKTARGAELVGSNGKNDNLFKNLPASVQLKEKGLELENSTNKGGRNQHKGSFEHPGDDQDSKNDKDGYVPVLPRESLTLSEQVSGAEANVQVLKKPNRAFGALLGTSAAKRKFDPGRKEEEEVKLEQIKSSVNLPFHSFLGKVDKLQPVVKEPAKPPGILHHEEPVAVLAMQDIILLDDDSDEEAINDDPKSTDDKIEENKGNIPITELASESHLQDIILLDDDSDEEPVNDVPIFTDEKSEQNEGNTPASCLEINKGDVTLSLSDLSSSFKKCFESTNQKGNVKQVEQSQESTDLAQFKPFDYEAARTQVSFGDNQGRNTVDEGDESGRSRPDAGNRKKSSAVGQPEGSEESGGFQLGRRRQAFPATGNRSATFR